MSERAGRGEVRVKPHLLDQYRPTHKPCSPLQEHSLGTRSYIRTPIHLVWGCFVQVGLSKSLQEGLPGPLPRAFRAVRVPNPVQSRKKTGPLSGAAQASEPFRGCKGTFQHPPQPLPGLTGLQGFQAKPLQAAPWDSSGALKAPPISLNKEMAMIGTLASRPLGLPGLP